jgi:iron complex outermembrane recepter protein
MIMTRSTRRAAILMTTALGLTMLGPQAWAQAHPPEQPAEQPAARPDAPPAAGAPTNAEIIVTGSRIRGTAPIGSTVVAMSNADIAAAGRVTLQQAIEDLPQVFNLGVSEGSRGQSGGSGNIVYGNSINLRGIGPNATLIMVDGHRVTNDGRSIDPSILPTLGVERVEVVADGASAIYGSDAVAGVVNLIPRRHFTGLEMVARGGISDDGVYNEKTLGAAFGHKFERGQFMLAYEHVEKSNLNGNDRSFFRSNQTSSGGSNYSVTKCAPGTLKANGISYAMPAQLTQANAGSLVAGTSNSCNDLQGQDLLPSQRYDSFNSTFDYDLTDWLSFTADGFYSYRAFTRLPAYTNATITVPSTNAFFVRPAGFTGSSYTIDYNFVNDSVRNMSWGHAQSWQISPGLKAKLPHGWQAEVLLDKGRTYDISSSTAGLNNAALTAALASSNPATAFDPYGLGRTTPATLAGIFNQVSINPTIGRFTGYEARLNGPLFALPAGKVKLALGYEGQEFNMSLGRQSGNPGVAWAWTSPGRRVDSAYAELVVPVFGPDNALPALRKLDLDAAVRYDRYSDVGSTTNPKFGLNWTPVERMTVRGSYGTSFRAPTLPQIYGNTSQLYVQSYQNPNGGAPITGVALSGGNPNLKPETATTWSVGMDYEPVPRLRLSLTYWSVDYKNQVISLLSDLSVLTRAAQYNGTGIIVQGAAASTIVANYIASGMAVSGALPGGSAANVTTFVDGRSFNLGRSITHGFDFSANYVLPTDRAGRFTFNVAGTYLTEYLTQQSPGAPFLDQLNQIYQPLQFKARASVNWDIGRFSALVRANHVGGYANTAVTPVQKVASYTPIDLNLSFRVGDKAKPFTLGLEVRNLFDVNPPYVNIAPSSNGGGGYDPTTTDPVGRLIAVSARKTF